MNIIKEFINSTNNEYINREISKITNDKDYLYRKGKGLNIGSMSSQILATFYLNDIDHYIKENLRIKYYVRYVDDFVLMDRDYNYLLYCLDIIKTKLYNIGLVTNAKTRIYDINKGFTFLGYKFFVKNKRLIIKIKYDNNIKIRKKLKYLKKYKKTLVSYKGYYNISNINYKNI